MAQSVERPSTATDAHLAAMDWLDEHAEAAADDEGEWIAVADGRILAHGDSVVEVIREAESQGYADPLLVPVIPYPFIGLRP
jgi:uncharacterized Zn ribbon protein